MPHETQNFHLEEYRQIRTEVVGLLTRIEALFRYSIIASVGVFAWLITTGLGATSASQACLKLTKDLLFIGWIIPPLFVLLCGLMAGTTMIRVVQIGQYLRNLEIELGKESLGWQKFLGTKKPILVTFTAIVWALLLLSAVVAASVGLKQTSYATGVCKPDAAEAKRSNA
jgi:hypothetical protein